jgi:Ferritin-like domain
VTLTRRGLVVGLGALAAVPATAVAQEQTDGELLEELLTLERRQEEAYAGALERDAIEPSLGRLLLAQEREHIRGLGLAFEELGARPAPEASVPDPRLGAALGSRRAFARFAVGLEQEAMDAYAASAPLLKRKELRMPLGSIMMCEAAHQVALRAADGSPLVG